MPKQLLEIRIADLKKVAVECQDKIRALEEQLAEWTAKGKKIEDTIAAMQEMIQEIDRLDETNNDSSSSDGPVHK